MKNSRLRRIGKEGRRWLTFRKDYLESHKDDDGYLYCADCGTPLTSPDLHHLKGRGAYPQLRYEESNIVALCRADHQRRHGQR